MPREVELKLGKVIYMNDSSEWCYMVLLVIKMQRNHRKRQILEDGYGRRCHDQIKRFKGTR